MIDKNNILSPGEILKAIPGLTRDKLNYWALKCYIDVVVEKRANRGYNFFKEKDLPIIKKAYEYIVIKKMKDREAFNKIHGKHRSFSDHAPLHFI
jgi:hypothetical protein